MLKIKILAIALLALNVAIAQETSQNCAKKRARSNSLKISPYVDQTQIDLQKKYDVTFYRLQLNMTNTTTALSGVTEIHARATQAIDSALVEFFDGFTIHQIQVNGTPVTTYARHGQVLYIPINLPQNSAFTISIDYAGTPPTAATNPLGGAGMTNDDSPTWGNQVTWSLSEPFSAFEWFPCKQDLRDKADSVQVTVTVPDHLMAGSNGLLDSVTTTPGYKTFHWMHRYPIAYYLISVAVSNYYDYTIYANPAGAAQPLMIQNFIYNNTTYLAQYQDDIDETVDFIELFADLYGPYPFQNEKYGHCLAPLSGGMEHQTMTTQGFFNNTLTSHELAHQWWGDYVTCASWADIWINEGFASYSENLMLQNLYSINDAKQEMSSIHTNVMSNPGGSVWVADSLDEDAIFDSRLVYNKGGAIIHTLRYIINNDQLFFDLLKDFLATYAYSTATGLDFKNHAENFTGMDFSDFFNQWYYGEGYPTYSVQYQPETTGVWVKVNQTVSKSSVTPLFTNPIDVTVNRTGTLSDTIVRIAINSNATTVFLPIENVQSITAIDPNNYVINKIGGITQVNDLGVEQAQMENENTILYPNPTEHQLTVVFPGEKTRELSIIDHRGQTVFSTTVTSNTTVDVSHLAAGQYLVEIKGKNKNSVIRKVIKR